MFSWKSGVAALAVSLVMVGAASAADLTMRLHTLVKCLTSAPTGKI